MKNKYALLFGPLLLAHALHAQPDLMSRVATYNTGGLVSMSTEEVYDEITNTSNSGPEQHNVVRYNSVYYHAFCAADPDYDIYLRTSADGVSWSAPVLVSDDTTDHHQIFPSLAVYDDGGNTVVVVAWDDRRDASAQLRVATSVDGGAIFSHSTAVSSHVNAVYMQGGITVDGGGRLYAAWSMSDGGCMGTVWLSTSDDNGFSWTPMASIFASQCYTGNHVHTTAAGPDSVMVAVSEDQFNHTNIIAVHSTDGGLTFTPNAVTTFTGFQTITAYAASAVRNGRIHMVVNYGETTGSVTNVLYVTSTDWGQTWSAPVSVNDTTALFTTWAYQSGQAPSMAVSPSTGNIYIGWADQRAGTDNFEVYLSRSTDDGVTWDSDHRVNEVTAPTNQGWTAIALEDLGGGNENVLVTWNDDRFAVGVPEMAVTTTNWIHPVPASDRITVDPPATMSGAIRFEVIDARGATVMHGIWSNNGQQVLDVSALRPGMHVMRLVSDGQLLAMPWIME
jgi:hypothetical protein